VGPKLTGVKLNAPSADFCKDNGSGPQRPCCCDDSATRRANHRPSPRTAQAHLAVAPDRAQPWRRRRGSLWPPNTQPAGFHCPKRPALSPMRAVGGAAASRSLANSTRRRGLTKLIPRRSKLSVI